MSKISLLTNSVLQGNAKEVLTQFTDESIDCIITSPPYYGLRDYGITGQIGLEKTPEEYVSKLMEVFKECKRILKNTGTFWLNIGDTYNSTPSGLTKEKMKEWGEKGDGLYKRLSYRHSQNGTAKNTPKKLLNFYQPKCMLMMPERVAFALIDDGWILRNKIIWYKRNHMPSSVKDRFANCWEYVYFFTKSKKYYFDLDAVREAQSYPEDVKRRMRQDAEANVNPFHKGILECRHYQGKFNGSGEKAEQFGSPRARNERKIDETAKFFIEKGSGGNVNLPGEHPLGKNPGDVIKSNLNNFDDNYWWNFIIGESHSNIYYKQAFEIMKEWMIKNDCYDYSKFYEWWKGNFRGKWSSGTLEHGQSDKLINSLPFPKPETRFLGKNPSDFWDITTKPFKEAHFAVFPEELCIKPIKAGCPKDGVVLDPFCGAGTALVVAKKLGRNYIGIDLKEDYCEMARKRLANIPEKLDRYST